MKIAIWISAVLIVFGSSVALFFVPDLFTPAVDFMLSIFLFLLAYMLGSKQEIQAAAKRANQKWLPQAESVVYRLLTLQSNVKKMAISSRNNCHNISLDLPELNTPDYKPVKVRLSADCTASSDRLDDIASQLYDSINDWGRFISDNCDGEECNRIFMAISERESKLQEEIASCSLK